jgi:hypothetical protein
MRLGELRVDERRARRGSIAAASWHVRCACCATKLAGTGRRRTARGELKACGWSFDHAGGGWLCAVCSR